MYFISIICTLSPCMFTESVLIKLPFGPFALGQQSSVVKISLDNPQRRINKEPGAKQITIDKYVSIYPHTAGERR